MSFRPKAAHWFEARIPRDQTVYALQVLVHEAGIELEERGIEASPCVDSKVVRHLLARIDKLISQHAEDLPKAAPRPRRVLAQPEALVKSVLEQLQDWAAKLLKTRRLIVDSRQETERLNLLLECLQAMQEESQDIGTLRQNSQFLYKQLFACPRGEAGDIAACNDLYAVSYPGDQHDFLLLACDINKKELMESATTLFNCRQVEIPEWLSANPAQQIEEVRGRLNSMEKRQCELLQALKRLQNDNEISEILVEARLLRWLLVECIGETADHTNCRLAGWTLADDPQVIQQQLAQADVEAEVFFTDPPFAVTPPVKHGDSSVDSPFRWIVNLLGTTGEKEVDPTPLVKLIAPLLFGFMFPDLGHGLLLIAAGLFFGMRYKKALILVPCGAAAAVFGFLFGAFFGRHDLFSAPFGTLLQQPLELLKVTLVLGISLILLGLVLSGVEAWWRREQRRWWLEEAPVILLYLSLAALFVWPGAWKTGLLALGWFAVGAALLCQSNAPACVAGRFGRLLQSTMQLVNASLSFLRVGAFALMHMAFSTMILNLVQAIETPLLQAGVFVVAHLVVVVLESLIVLIQTTRLIALEFFSRFLHFEGRVYKPLKLSD